MKQVILSIFIIVLVQGHVFGQESTEQAIDYSLTTQVNGDWVLTSTIDLKTNDTTQVAEDVVEFLFTY
ncbi:MAG: hypothetical protein KDC92_17145 [Bacteroidetes bacterium]|nr:hypothetical protein [Bacteroidota bacterium]